MLINLFQILVCISIYENFYNFTKNDKIHFSLWIWLFKDKTPIKFVYESSENLLLKAKENSKEKMQKTVNENMLNSLKYFWICFAEKENYKVMMDNDETKGLFNLSLEMKNNSSTYYKLYQALKQARYELENDNYSEYILIWARILYMLKRNLNKEEFEKIEDIIKPLFKLIKNKTDKLDTISEILLKFAYTIYKYRKWNE